MVEQRPGDADVPVRERRGRDVGVAPEKQLHQPVLRIGRAGLDALLRDADHCARPVNEQRTQVRIPRLHSSDCLDPNP